MNTRRDFGMEKAVPILMALGFCVHLVNLAHYVHFGRTGIKDVILPTVDLVLGSWMAFCAFGLIAGARGFFQRFGIHGGWRKVVYWVITFYVTVSVPGHVRFLLTGDTKYFDFFPWWFSPVIMFVYVLFIAYFWTMKARPVVATSLPPT